MYKNLLSLLVIIAILSSCSNDTDGGNARLQVSLVDAPAGYDQVNIDVQEVNVKFGDASSDEESEDESGWTNVSDFTPQVFDILKLVNGEEEVLVDREIPSGTLGEIRLVLGTENTLVMDGQSYELTIPSGSQSGLKIKLNEQISEGITYKIILDFDAAKSIVEAGNSGKINLKPVIHANLEALTGVIPGSVSPASGNVVVYAIAGSDSLSTYTSDEGGFLLRALDAGTYDVTAISETDTVTQAGVLVEVGTVSDSVNLVFPIE